MVTKNHTKEEILEILQEVKDPEIPVLTVVDMGIVRDVKLNGEKLTVVITPTYSGCPAMQVIEEDIIAKLEEYGMEGAEVETVISPPWTTDWITDEAKEKLREYGIAPPANSSVDKGALIGEPKEVRCPQCGSDNTEMLSQFGSTPCKAQYRCKDCKEPFDYFKCI